jgi:NAD-dependent dihydropyrimidine dehydrogenase PreA subunit
MMFMPPVINKGKCSQCGTCVDICPEDVLFLDPDGESPRVVYPDECWHCASCVIDCPQEAVRLYIPLPMRL